MASKTLPSKLLAPSLHLVYPYDDRFFGEFGDFYSLIITRLPDSHAYIDNVIYPAVIAELMVTAEASGKGTLYSNLDDYYDYLYNNTYLDFREAEVIIDELATYLTVASRPYGFNDLVDIFSKERAVITDLVPARQWDSMTYLISDLNG